MKTKALYGFSPELEPFINKTPAEQVAHLQSWGNTAIFGGYEDPDFVAAAHAAGMMLYAEIGLFVHEKWWKENPASRPIRHDGQALEPEEWYYGVNPSTPVVRHRLLEELEKLLTGHVLDGVWLDFIRWPCHWGEPGAHSSPHVVRRPDAESLPPGHRARHSDRQPNASRAGAAGPIRD